MNSEAPVIIEICLGYGRTF